MNKKTGKLLLTLVAAFLLIFNGYAMTSDGKAYAADNYNVYVPATSLEVGKNYIITDGTSGTVHALSTVDARATQDVTIADDGNIYSTDSTFDSRMVFTAGGQGTAVNYFVNDGKYVVQTTENNKDVLGFQNTQPSGITWAYNSNNHYLTYRSGNSTYYLYYKPNGTGDTIYDRYRIKAQSSVGTEQEVFLFEETTYVKHDVTFNVENGKWNDEESEAKKVTLSGPVGTELKLDANQIPAVGEKPDTHFEAGDWDVTPDTTTPIEADTTFKYTYAKSDHVWSEPTYDWNGYTSVTAERHCTIEGCTETESEEGVISYEVTKQATCTAPGETTYTATFENTAFKDTKVDDTAPAALGHDMDHHNAKAPTCTEDGNVEYWACRRCNKNFSDEAGDNELDNVVVGKTGHETTHVDAVAPTCTEDGNVEHWACSKCKKNFKDEEGTEELDTIVDPATGHTWVAGKVTPATETAEGQKLFTCSVCEATKTEAIPKLKPSGSDPNHKAADGTATGAGASAACAEKAITTAKSDADPAGSTFGGIKLRSTKQAKNSITLKWTKKNGAVKYVVYGNACGKNNSMKKLATLGNKNAYTVKKINKKLKKGTYHKFIVVALDKNDMVVSTSKIIHVATKGGKVTNAKSVTVKKGKKTVSKLAVKKGSTAKLKGTANKAIKSQTLKKHRAVTFESSNSKIATVTKSGKITAKAKGTCYIYAYAQNGAYKSVKVTVK